jgi:hypothetical protein
MQNMVNVYGSKKGAIKISVLPCFVCGCNRNILSLPIDFRPEKFFKPFLGTNYLI